MSATDSLSLVTSAQQAIHALQVRLANQRGLRHALVMEIAQNLELLRQGLLLKAQPCEVIAQLQDAAYRQALASGFRFNRLSRAKISAKSTANKPALRRYHGWSTTRLTDNIYHKITHLKQLCALSNTGSAINFHTRLQNLFHLLAVLALHIGSDREGG